MSIIPTIDVAGHKIGRLGYGLMQLTWGSPPPQEQALEAMKAAAEAGATCWATAAFYNLPNDPYGNIKLIRTFLDMYPEYEDKIVLAVKGGYGSTTYLPYTTIEEVRTEITEMNDILSPKSIDVFAYARLPDRPVKEVFEELVQLKEEGLFGAIGGGEMSVESIKKAVEVTPLAMMEIELSLFSYEPAVRAVVEYSNSTGLPVLAYSPLGRGFLTGSIKSYKDIEGTVKAGYPRFQENVVEKNLKLVNKVREIADKKGITPSQVALAWVLNVGKYTIAIPGSSKVARVQENTSAAQIKLTPDELKEINDFLDEFEPIGERYPSVFMTQLMK